MKATPVRSITLVALFSLFAVSSHADATAHAQIIKERDAVLSEIVAYYESQFPIGLGNEETLVPAQLALCSFRRDTAATIPEKIKQQKLIVQAHEKRLATVNVRVKNGLATRLDILTATDVLLQAKQLLEELKLSGKKE